MNYSVVLYRVVIKDEYNILIPYNNTLKKIGVFHTNPAKVVSQIEAEWIKKAAKNDRYALAVGFDWLYLNPAVVEIGASPDYLVKMKLITDTFSVQIISLLGVPKFVAGHCEGERAMEHWEKGRKPKLPIQLRQAENPANSRN